MAGCINGLNSIEVKAPNGEPSILFDKLTRKMDINDAYRAYLLSEAPDIREKFGFRIESNGEANVDDVIAAMNSRGLGFNLKTHNPNPNTSTSTDSVAEKIVEASKMIGEPEQDADGNQGDTYPIFNASGQLLKNVARVSGFMSRFIYGRDNKKPDGVSMVEHLVANKVNSEFRNVPEGGTVHFLGRDLTREEYAENLRKSYNQGITKGNIIHALLELQWTQHPKGSPEYNAIVAKLEKYRAMSSVDPSNYDWVLDKENYYAILSNLGIKKATSANKLDPSLEDKLYSEVAVYSELLGVAGRIDTLRETADGYIQVIDAKTGNNFDKESLGSRIMKFGSQTGTLRDDSKGRAKLQTMLYSMMIKLNHPEAKLLPPSILHLANEISAKNPSSVHETNVADYLGMIEDYYKSEEKEVYKQLIAASPEIFNPYSYGGYSNKNLAEEYTNAKDPGKVLMDKEQELLKLQHSVKMRSAKDGSLHGDWTLKEKLKREELMKSILEARSMGIKIPAVIDKDHEVRMLSKLLGTINDTHNPFIQAYAQTVEQARDKIRTEHHNIMETFNHLLTKVVKEREGNDPNGRFSTNFRIKDSSRFFAKYIITKEDVDDEGNTIVNRGVITKKDKEWNSLTATEQEFISYMQDTMKNLFNEVMVNGPNAVLGTYKGKPQTKLDVYNENGRNFKWSDDFIPRTSVTREEVLFRLKDKFAPATIKASIKDWMMRSLSLYYEEHVDHKYDNDQYGIPARFLGAGKFSHNPDIHSSNLEQTFTAFTQHFVNKKHYDTVYALGDSIKQYMNMQLENGNPIMKNTAEFMERHMTRQLQGRIFDSDKNLLRKPLGLADNNGRDINISLIKSARTFATTMAAAGIWLKPLSAFKNLAQAWWAVNKHGWSNHIANFNWAGTKMDNVDTQANSARIHAEWAVMQKEFVMGRGKAHPIKVFMDTFHLYPDASEFGGAKSDTVTGIGKLISKRTLSALHSYPEEWSTAMLAINVMMSSKIQEGKYAGQSMWDVYSKSVVVDPETGNGSFKLPDDFTRGRIQDGTGTIRDWKGLEPIEVQKLKRIIQTVKGGYRLEERSMLESTALGEVAMIFKRWLPSAIVQGFHGKRQDPSMGFFEKAPGEDYYVWRSRMAEGRWRTIAGVIGNASGFYKNRGYNIDQLSDIQRQNVADLAVTLLALTVLGGSYMFLMGDMDDEDGWKDLAFNTIMRVGEQWNFVDWLDTATSTPMAAKAAKEISVGFVTSGMSISKYLLTDDEDDLYTKRGDLRGANQILKNLPITSWWYTLDRFADSIDD